MLVERRDGREVIANEFRVPLLPAMISVETAVTRDAHPMIPKDCRLRVVKRRVERNYQSPVSELTPLGQDAVAEMSQEGLVVDSVLEVRLGVVTEFLLAQTLRGNRYRAGRDLRFPQTRSIHENVIIKNQTAYLHVFGVVLDEGLNVVVDL